MNEKHSKILITILLFLIAFMYFQYYGKYNTDFKILQVYLDNIHPQILQERYPVLLYNKIVDPQQLINTLFYGLYNFKMEMVEWIKNPVLTSCKYTILFNNQSQSWINIVSPKNRTDFIWNKSKGEIVSQISLNEMKVEFVTIKLKKNQILILPPYWIYQTAKKIKRIHLNDFPSKIYEVYYKMRFKNSSGTL